MSNNDESKDRAEKLGERGLGFRVHADDDDKGNKAVVGDYFGLLRRPCAPVLDKSVHCRHSSTILTA
ncbi:hypothetical protein H5410_028412 [Solanum commersonii]|uniref:Uncharacterized protein n=1 Tax=Solanum commersonii TaxID=4109 RepID=A0A9J5Z4R3_SOLCO|nr:hypothetical protein H5410_028412 [Solanum commersonii]